MVKRKKKRGRKRYKKTHHLPHSICPVPSSIRNTNWGSLSCILQTNPTIVTCKVIQTQKTHKKRKQINKCKLSCHKTYSVDINTINGSAWFIITWYFTYLLHSHRKQGPDIAILPKNKIKIKLRSTCPHKYTHRT